MKVFTLILTQLHYPLLPGTVTLIYGEIKRWSHKLMEFTVTNADGPYLNDVYPVRGRGVPKCRRSKGGCVDLVLQGGPQTAVILTYGLSQAYILISDLRSLMYP